MADAETNIPEDPRSNFYAYFRFKLGRDTPSDARNTLLVVFALIAAVTFQAGVNPPGGVWQGNYPQNSSDIRYAGKAILASHQAPYIIFLIFNTLAFSASTSAILFLVWDCPFQVELLIAVYSMNATYGGATAAVTPPGTLNWFYILIVTMSPYALRVLMEIKRRRKKKMSLAAERLDVQMK